MDTASALREDPLHLLVVDDDADIRTMLCDYLARNGYRVSAAADAAGMHRQLAAAGAGSGADAGKAIDLILLDLGLPDANGLDLLRELRPAFAGRVIVVSGQGETVERIVGLELGADDYVSKPFERREVLARVRSVLRRAQPVDGAAGHDRLEFDGLALEPQAHRLLGRGGAEIALTHGEFALLETLARHPDHAFTRDRLIDHLHGRMAGPFDRAIDAQVARLRRKIERDPARPTLIRSIRGTGYLLAGPVVQRGGA
jgi:two-component system, OmpR family, response regulator